jgi:hypothetical protein
MLIGLLSIFLNDTPSDNIVLDTSLYDPKFNWYNTNGELALIEDNRVIFNGSNRTNVYQDAVSIITLKANDLELYANVSFEINSYSNNPKDEFAIFATSNIVTYDENEFGFVLPENDKILYAYIQSPDLQKFFIWKPILYVDKDNYILKAVYDEDSRDVRFYVDDVLVWHTNFVELNANIHLAIVSHKLSDEEIDISDNRMIIYEAYLSHS